MYLFINFILVNDDNLAFQDQNKLLLIVNDF